MVTEKKKSKYKGQKKSDSEGDSTKDNPLIKIDNKIDFEIEVSNLLQEPEKLLLPDFENFDLSKEKDHFNFEKLNDETTIKITLRYYEYICIATFKFKFIVPILQSGLNAKDVFDMIKHSLRNHLLLNCPSFDVIFEPDMQYRGKIKY